MLFCCRLPWLGWLPEPLFASILGIRPAFVSRVSNANVLQRSSCHGATQILCQRQLLLFGKALRSPHDHPMHVSSFIPGSLELATSRYVRRVGRPRREWITNVRNRAFQFVNGHRELTRLVQNPHVWHDTIYSLFVHAPPGV